MLKNSTNMNKTNLTGQLVTAIMHAKWMNPVNWKKSGGNFPVKYPSYLMFHAYCAWKIAVLYNIIIICYLIYSSNFQYIFSKKKKKKKNSGEYLLNDVNIWKMLQKINRLTIKKKIIIIVYKNNDVGRIIIQIWFLCSQVLLIFSK